MPGVGEVEEVEIVLTNGDRLKGELVSEGETMVLKHAVLGELSMANGDVRMIERPNPPASFVEAEGPEARSSQDDSHP